MALPSPCFLKNSNESVNEKSHVTKEEVKKTNHFVAYCKYCREGFRSENELFQHRKSHERCPYDGCQFNASTKVIAEHIQRVHLKTNTLVKIQDLTTPEQIEKWKEERRKRYPTTANVILRQQAQEIRLQRGEKLQDRQQRFGDFQQRNHIRNFDNRDHQKGNRQRHQKNRQNRNQGERKCYKFEDKTTKDEKMETTVELIEMPSPVEVKNEQSKPVNTFKPQDPPKLLKEVQLQEKDSSDDEIATPRFKGTSQMKNFHGVETLVKEKAALSILGMYGSDSDSETEDDSKKIEEATLQSSSNNETIKDNDDDVAQEKSKGKASEVNDNEVVHENNEERAPEVNGGETAQEIDDGEAPDEVPIVHNCEMFPPDTFTSSVTEKASRKRKRDQQSHRRDNRTITRSGLDYSKLRRRPYVNPFLEKLLQDDIRHERNFLLQCVNYVVKNNFFGVGQSETVPAATNDDKTGPKQEDSTSSEFLIT